MSRGTSLQLTRTHRILIGLVVAGAVLIAAIGFAGSYAAVRELALQKGFGDFSLVFPIGIDAGICVLLALDLLLTWLRIPFPLLRQTAWLLTAATIAFNGAAAWPDPLGVGMHAVIPVLFVVSVEAARHAVGRIADITADKHMEGVRLTRWLLSPVPTFKLWRRMKLWELRSYEQVIKLEQDRLIYQARLQARFGRNWRRKAPVESLMPLRLAKYGVPLGETAQAGLAAAGIEPALLPLAPAQAVRAPKQRQSPAGETSAAQKMESTQLRAGEPHPSFQVPSAADVRTQPEPTPDDARAGGRLADAYRAWIGAYGSEPTSAQFALWLQDRYGIATAAGDPLSDEQIRPLLQVLKQRGAPAPDGGSGPDASQDASEEETWTDYFYNAWLTYAAERGSSPDAAALAEYVYQRDGILGATGQPVTADELRDYVALFQERDQGDPEAVPAPAAAGPTAETVLDHESEESHEEGPLSSSPDDDAGEQSGTPPGLAASWQEQTRATERHTVHASGEESGGRSIVQARVPKPRDEDESDAGESAPGISEGEVDQEDGSHLTGPARVEFHYRQLPPQEQELSAKALAPVLAERCGYREGTVRKYLGQIKRAAGV
ncbi:DUF2637 domain-containing protein [Streptomyces sp. NBC_00378]|uniref:DUF2637 domain-containing protein n=1 Tax=unclassified Streptomyces TaxID=2593676 RepID=UPI002251268E|nr:MULTISPECIES: DUF2637 domain-containing protein [unclassified Streptomyces]MCX5112326.1 DUF2637 domain-containing protein [Streptomyces sp. NBC_00378]